MVKSAGPPTYSPVAVKVEAGRRIRLPDPFPRHLEWLHGTGPIKAWLLMIRLGRYRLVSEEQVDASPRLKTVADRILNPPERDTEIEPFEAEDSASAVLSARLLPATLSPRGPGWRLTLPKDALGLFEPTGKNTNRVVYLLFSEGYLEIWSVDHLVEALQAPLDQIIP